MSDQPTTSRPVMAADVRKRAFAEWTMMTASTAEWLNIYEFADYLWLCEAVACGWDGESDPPWFLTGPDGRLWKVCAECLGSGWVPDTGTPGEHGCICHEWTSANGHGWVPITEEDTEEDTDE